MRDYNDLPSLLRELETVQSNESDEREKSRECQIFVTKKDGQWEEKIFNLWRTLGKPRYTYDRVSPILDGIVGELDQNEFAATVNPAGGEATKENAAVLDSLVRSIQNWSDASHIYKKIARKLTINGFDACRVIHDYQSGDSFDQDLIIKYIPNSIDRVWFDAASEEQDRSDAEWAVVLQALTSDQYSEMWPKGSKQSVNSNREADYYANKRETITVGEVLYKKKTMRTIVQMSNGRVYDKEESTSIIDELAAIGVTIIKERDREEVKVWSRYFDGSEWLNDAKETVFSIIPIVPFYHCFEVVEDKLTWRRIVEKLMDAQRIFNYTISRQVEEGALAPRAKIWMTKKQSEGHEAQLGKMNTSPEPVQFYNPDEKAQAPYQTQGAQINPSLAQISMDAANNIEAIAGMYGANLAKNPGVQSGVAIELQQAKGDTGNSSFYIDIAKGITYLCKVLIDGAPNVYDANREVLLTNADGSTEMTMLHDRIFDDDTQQWVEVNNLSGSYAVTCSMGAMFKNRLEQANTMLLELGKVYPDILQGSADIFVNNINAPNMAEVAKRTRADLLKAGRIPEDQMTDEELEKAQLAAQEQGQQPDAMMLAAQAEMGKAQADNKRADNDRMRLDIEMAKLRLEEAKVMQSGEKNSVAYMEAISKIKNIDAGTMKTVADTYNTDADTQLKQAELADKEMSSRISGMPTDELIGLLNQWG